MLDESLLVWIISGSQDGPRLVAFYKVPHPRPWYEERVLEIRDAFNRGQPSEFDPQISEQLFEGLFPGPFAQYVTAAKSVIFVPDDILFLLPFEVLSPNASKSEYALLKTPTSYFPSAGAFRLLREIVRTKRSGRTSFLVWLIQSYQRTTPVIVPPAFSGLSSLWEHNPQGSRTNPWCGRSCQWMTLRPEGISFVACLTLRLR
jgi:hypothetical protein